VITPEVQAVIDSRRGRFGRLKELKGQGLVGEDNQGLGMGEALPREPTRPKGQRRRLGPPAAFERIAGGDGGQGVRGHEVLGVNALEGAHPIDQNGHLRSYPR